jgi:predicted lipid-binding transport protein (Tim44 family)
VDSVVIAHLGGLAAGLLLGALLMLAPQTMRRPRADLAAGMLFVTLIVLPWWLALNEQPFSSHI